MKITAQQAADLFKVLGLQDVVLVAEESESEYTEETEDAVIAAVDQSRTPIIKTRLETDVKETLEKSVLGRVNGSVRSVFARVLGVNRKSLTEDMTFEQMAEAAANHYKGTLSEDKASHQQQIDDIIAANEQALTAKENDWTGKYNSLNEKYIKRDRIETLSKTFDKAPFPKDYDRNVGISDFDQYLNENYHVVYNEDKTIDLFEKANPEKVAMNAANNKKISLNEIGVNYFKPRGAWMENLSREDINSMPKGNDYVPAGGEQKGSGKTKAVEMMEAYLGQE
jgi:hypothetical protein